MSSKKIVECVPNFSEGRDRSVIDAIACSISSVAGVTLLDVDPGADTNCTVYTFVGDPEAVAAAALAAARTAHALIDMSRELGVPVYLYEKAASRPETRSLAAVREGKYEALAGKLAKPEWKPDFGPATFSPRWGATAVGAREFLIAYNVNPNARDRKLANEIALNIREAGRAAKDAAGKHYLRMMGTSEGASEAELVDTAVRSMGLASVAPFDPTKKIVEYAGRTEAMQKGYRALLKVLINLGSITDLGFVATMQERSRELFAEAERLKDEAMSLVMKAITA